MQQDPPKVSPIKAISDLARQNKIVAEYQLEKESGPDHAKTYTVRLRFGEKEYIGVDRSIKLAQRAAAKLAMDDHQDFFLQKNFDKKVNISQSPTVALNTWAARHHIPTQYDLLYEQTLPALNNSSWNHRRTMFYYRLYLGQELYFDGHGSSHQQARANCACHALNYISQNEQSILMSHSLKSTEIQQKSPVSIMYERARQLGLTVRMEQPEPLTITYLVGEQYSTTGIGTTKQVAKKIAAQKMLEILPVSTETDKRKQKLNRKHSNQHKKFIEQRGSTGYSVSEQINPITRLYQIARARDIKIEFKELEYSTKDRLFHFFVQLGENDSADGYGKSKQIAKRSTAQNLLSKLNPNLLSSVNNSLSSTPSTVPTKSLLKRDENSNKQHEKKHVHFIEDQLIEHEKKTINHQSSLTIKQQLINACGKLNIDIQYDDQLLMQNNQYETILTLSKDDRMLAKFRAHATSLTRAQENVSLTAWKNLQQLFNGSVQLPKTTLNKRYQQPQTPISVQQQ